MNPLLYQYTLVLPAISFLKPDYCDHCDAEIMYIRNNQQYNKSEYLNQ